MIGSLRPVVALLAALTAFGSAFAQEPDFGFWHGQYRLEMPDMDMVFDLTQLASGDALSASGSVSAYAERPACLPDTNASFCRHLANVGAGSAAWFDISGARANGRRAAYVVFRLRDGGSHYVLALAQRNGRYSAQIHSAEDGQLMAATVTRAPHLCQQGVCANDYYRDLMADPGAALGVLSSLAYLSGYPSLGVPTMGSVPLPDLAPQPGPAPSAVAAAGAIDGQWEIRDHNGNSLGVVAFLQSARSVTGSGRLQEQVHFGATTEVQLRPRSQTGEAVDFDVIYFANGSGEQVRGRLLLEWPGQSGRPCAAQCDRAT